MYCLCKVAYWIVDIVTIGIRGVPNIGKMYTTDEVMKEVLKYKSYYNGITVSGGEPTLQPEFVTELFKKTKENGLSTCLDTSGYVDLDIITPILEYTDLVILDIKHINDEKCKWLTGKSNKKALTLAKYLDKLGVNTWIRHVLVPGITDDKESLEELARFVKSLNNVEKFELLPYHTMGVYKWKELGLKYPLEGIKDCTLEQQERADEIINNILMRWINGNTCLYCMCDYISRKCNVFDVILATLIIKNI